MRKRRIICPVNVNSEVFTTVSPVTHTAEVAINRASVKERLVLQSEGIDSRAVPIVIRPRKVIIK
jgi:hypothetical protein